MKGTTKRLVVATILVAALGSIAAGAFFYFSRSSTGWEGRLLDADWPGLYAELMRDGAQKPRPTHFRALLAHACLATNRNNEALRWFLSLRRPEEVAAWTVWTKEFGRRHPREPVALYLLADAAARDGRLPEAREALDRAINRDDRFAMAWSARGVVRLLEGDQDGSRSDLQHATEVAADFSDAWSNLGAFWVTRSAAKGALDAYQEALRIDPYFALGYNGRGCAKVGNGDYQSAAEDFEVAFRLLPELIPAGANQAYAFTILTGGDAVWRERRPGMQILTQAALENTKYSDLHTAQDLIRYEQSIGNLPDLKAAFRIVRNGHEELTRRDNEIVSQMTRIRSGIRGGEELERNLLGFDAALSLVSVPSPKGIRPDSRLTEILRGSKMVVDSARLLTPPDSAAHMWAKIMSPVVSPEMKTGVGALKGAGQSVVRLLAEGLDTGIYVGEAKYKILALKRDEISIGKAHLNRIDMSLVARAVQSKTDLRELDPYNVEGLLNPVTPPPAGDRDPLDALRRTTQARALPGANLSSNATNPGGVTGRPAQISVVEGRWPVLTGFSLLYSVPQSPKRGEVQR